MTIEGEETVKMTVYWNTYKYTVGDPKGLPGSGGFGKSRLIDLSNLRRGRI